MSIKYETLEFGGHSGVKYPRNQVRIRVSVHNGAEVDRFFFQILAEAKIFVLYAIPKKSLARNQI